MSWSSRSEADIQDGSSTNSELAGEIRREIEPARRTATGSRRAADETGGHRQGKKVPTPTSAKPARTLPTEGTSSAARPSGGNAERRPSGDPPLSGTVARGASVALPH